MTSTLFSARNILGLCLFLLFVLCVYPFLMLVFKMTLGAPEGHSLLTNVVKIVEGASTFVAVKNTILLSVASALIGLLLALPLSWILTRSNLPGVGIWRSLYCLPYAIPPYIGAIAWIYLANPSTGLLNSFFDRPLINIYGHFGLAWVMGSFFYTFILLSLLSALDRMDPSLEEAARLSGAGPWKVFRDVTLPLIFPSLMSGVLLVILAAAATFGVPALIGNPAGIFLMTTKIYTYQRMGSMSGLMMSGALSLMLLALAVVVLVINQRILQRGHFKTVSGKASRLSTIDLGRWKMPVTLLLMLVLFLVFGLPILGIVMASLAKVQGKFGLDNLGLQNFQKVFFEVNETPRAFANSFLLATSTATVTTFLGLIMAYIQVKTKARGRKLLDIIAALPYSTPGTVLALAFILAFGSHFLGLPFSLYNTLTLMGLCYMAKFLNFSIRTNADGLGQIDDCLAEAARVSGADWGTTLRTIWIPLMKPALMASWFLVFMPAFSELTMTILLTGPGLETLGTLLFQLQEYGDASGGGAAVLSLFIVFFVAGINFTVKVVSKGKYGL